MWRRGCSREGGWRRLPGRGVLDQSRVTPEAPLGLGVGPHLPGLRARRKAVWLEQNKMSHPSHENVLHLRMCFVSSKTQGFFIPAFQMAKGRFLKWRLPRELGCTGLGSPGQGATGGRGGTGRVGLY